MPSAATGWSTSTAGGPEDGPPMEEKVLDIKYDPNRTADIALVAGGNHKRYILATANMEIGDIIRTSAHIGRMTGEIQWHFNFVLVCILCRDVSWDFNLISDFCSQNSICRLVMQFECIENHIFLFISDYFRLFPQTLLNVMIFQILIFFLIFFYGDNDVTKR